MNNSQRLQISSTIEPGCCPGWSACRVWALSMRDLFFSAERVKAMTAGRTLRPCVEGRKAKFARFGQYRLILLVWLKTKQNKKTDPKKPS